MYIKACTHCEQEFAGTGPAAKYCEKCSDIRKQEVREQNRLRNEKARRAKGCKIGRGAPAGSSHPNYRHGFYVSQTQSQKYREKVRYCERCNIDTRDLSRWHWVMHHKDHNHSNHSESNLELLCKACHAKEHEVQNNFQGKCND